MKSKIASFVTKIITILIIFMLCFIGLIIYRELTKTNIANEVQDFVSNITISAENKKEQLKIPEVTDSISDIEENINDETIEGGVSIYRHYYNQLDDYAKIIYNAIYDNKENLKTGIFQISLGNEFSTLLSLDEGEKMLGEYYQSAIESFSYDNPDVFYIDYGKLYLNIETTTRRSKKTYKVFISSGNEGSYLTEQFLTKDKIDEGLNEIEKIKAYFIQNKKDDTYQNIKLVHDFLVESIEYEQSMSKSNIYDLYGALINKECVCSGYANAFKYLMDALDIPCIIVPGLATNSEGDTENHAWNYVQINDIWYAVDCTWDDPILIGPGFLTNSLKYRYFLKGEIDISKTHSPNGQLTENGKIFEFPVLSQVNY